MQQYVSTYHERRDLVYNGLKEHFKIIKPNGAFYVFPEAPRQNADEFVNQAIERKVFIIPGNVFSARNTHFRISFAVPNEKLLKGIDILNELARKF